MHIDRYEKLWMFTSGIFLVLLLFIIGYTAFAHGIHVPAASHAHEAGAPPLSRTPGVHKTGDNRYEIVIKAKVWGFDPAEITLPEGAKVDLILTSQDIIHGFRVPGTTLNSMIVPGQETRMTYEFKKPGEYLILCHEYCGAGHHLMTGKIVVEEGA